MIKKKVEEEDNKKKKKKKKKKRIINQKIKKENTPIWNELTKSYEFPGAEDDDTTIPTSPALPPPCPIHLRLLPQMPKPIEFVDTSISHSSSSLSSSSLSLSSSPSVSSSPQLSTSLLPTPVPIENESQSPYSFRHGFKWVNPFEDDNNSISTSFSPSPSPFPLPLPSLPNDSDPTLPPTPQSNSFPKSENLEHSTPSHLSKHIPFSYHPIHPTILTTPPSLFTSPISTTMTTTTTNLTNVTPMTPPSAPPKRLPYAKLDKVLKEKEKELSEFQKSLRLLQEENNKLIKQYETLNTNYVFKDMEIKKLLEQIEILKNQLKNKNNNENKEKKRK